jgi:hypothetical protein
MTAMYLVQLLLPVHDREGRPFDRPLFDQLAKELTDNFGGVTAYTRAPATGLWEEQSGGTVRDHIVVYEVMVEKLDAEWWAALRERLEVRLDQDELVVRAQEIRRL